MSSSERRSPPGGGDGSKSGENLVQKNTDMKKAVKMEKPKEKDLYGGGIETKEGLGDWNLMVNQFV